MFGAERHFVSDFSTRDAGAAADGFMQEFKNRFLTGAILRSLSHMIRQTSTNWPHPLSPKGKYGYGLDDVDSQETHRKLFPFLRNIMRPIFTVIVDGGGFNDGILE